MEKNALHTVDIRHILSLATVVDEYALGTDFILGEVSGRRLEESEAVLNMLRYPVRFDGYIIFFLKKGHLMVDLNLSTFELEERSLLVNVPGNIIKLSCLDQSMLDTELYFVLASREFMSGIGLDLNKVFQDSLSLLDNPCIRLSDEDLQLGEGYFDMARQVVLSGRSHKREIVGGLLTSYIYSIMDMWIRQLESREQEDARSSNRVNQIFERFIGLVTEYHSRERGMAFYADKLCLTPKYLSKLVKQASGRSAPDWIDSFVILEAKNLLKYSDKPIKEIVFLLHFPSQSVFYKYFKVHTGMTPSEYRKG